MVMERIRTGTVCGTQKSQPFYWTGTRSREPMCSCLCINLASILHRCDLMGEKKKWDVGGLCLLLGPAPKTLSEALGGTDTDCRAVPQTDSVSNLHIIWVLLPIKSQYTLKPWWDIPFSSALMLADRLCDTRGPVSSLRPTLSSSPT